MWALIITAIGVGMSIVYFLGTDIDSTILIAAAIMIVGGMIKAELGLLVEIISNAYMNIFGDDEDDGWYCDDCDDGEDDEDGD